jgi:hypothetical protein
MKVKQPTTMREAGSVLKERWLDRRVDKLSRENDSLREELDELKHDLDTEHGRSKETLDALSKARRPGRLKWVVLAGGAYVLGAKAGRGRYEQMRGWVRSMRPSDDDAIAIPDATTTSGATTSGGSTAGAMSGSTSSRSSGTSGTAGTARS